MINDLSLVLRNILDDPSLSDPLQSALKRFDRPTDPYTVDQNTVNLFLYDIRENMELRNNEPIIERLNGQATIQLPPLRVTCVYLVTAWIPGAVGEAMVLQEQLLLSQVLQALSRFSTIPPSFLVGTGLVGQEPSLPMMTAQTNGLRNPAEFWTAVGNKLRASFVVTVTISLPLFEATTVPIVATKQFGVQPIDNPAAREDLFEFGGRVADAGDNPVDAATVTLVEPGLVTTTDADGRYSFGLVAANDYTLRVEKLPATLQVTITVPATVGNDYNVQFP